MQGLVQGPDLRSSNGPGLPWNENTATFKLINFVDANDEFSVYDALPNGMLPGKVPLASKEPVGQLVETTCSISRLHRCRSIHAQGTCQTPRSIPGFKFGGWCLCDKYYTGRFCRIRDQLFLKPANTVHVELGVSVDRFSGLESDGTAFNMRLKLEFSWVDKRFPWDDGLYEGADAMLLLSEMWKPAVTISGENKNYGVPELHVRRNSSLEERELRESDVHLKLRMVMEVKQSFEPDFQDFPFDSHELGVDIVSSDSDMRLSLRNGNILVPPQALDDWQGEWPLTGDPKDWAVLPGIADQTFRLQMAVKRAREITVFRLILPMSVLVVMSWAGFWIRPGALMPRFASGFISFLALQGFKNYSIKQMPNGGAINGMSWIDV
jgi:hypothetical protein